MTCITALESAKTSPFGPYCLEPDSVALPQLKRKNSKPIRRQLAQAGQTRGAGHAVVGN